MELWKRSVCVVTWRYRARNARCTRVDVDVIWRYGVSESRCRRTEPTEGSSVVMSPIARGGSRGIQNKLYEPSGPNPIDRRQTRLLQATSTSGLRLGSKKSSRA